MQISYQELDQRIERVSKPNAWRQYLQACDEQRDTARRRDEILASWHASADDKQRAISRAAEAAARCVEALQAYRGDLSCGLVPAVAQQMGTVVERNSKALRGRNEHKIDRHRKLTEVDDVELEVMCDEYREGSTAIEIANRWEVSIAAVTVLLTDRGLMQTSGSVTTNRFANQHGKKARSQRKIFTNWVTDPTNLKAVAKLTNRGIPRNEIAKHLGVNASTINRAVRRCVMDGLIPPPMGVCMYEMLGYLIGVVGMTRYEARDVMGLENRQSIAMWSQFQQNYPNGIPTAMHDSCAQELEGLPGWEKWTCEQSKHTS